MSFAFANDNGKPVCRENETEMDRNARRDNMCVDREQLLVLGALDATKYVVRLLFWLEKALLRFFADNGEGAVKASVGERGEKQFGPIKIISLSIQNVSFQVWLVGGNSVLCPIGIFCALGTCTIIPHETKHTSRALRASRRGLIFCLLNQLEQVSWVENCNQFSFTFVRVSATSVISASS